MLPKDFPPKITVDYYFKRFSSDGAWARIHDALYRQSRDLEGREESPSYAIIDNQSVKTGPDAGEMVEFDTGKKVKGRKRQILVDTLGLILKTEVHSAGIQDRDGAALVFDKFTGRAALQAQYTIIGIDAMSVFSSIGKGTSLASGSKPIFSWDVPEYLNLSSRNSVSGDGSAVEALPEISMVCVDK